MQITSRVLWATAATLIAGIRPAPAADGTFELKQTIPLKGVDGKLDHLVVDAKGERLFVANKPNNTLDIVDLKTGKLVKQIPDQGKVSGVAYSADLDTIYVGNGAGTCNAFDGKDYKQVFSTPLPGADNVHYHSGTKSVFVAHGPMLTELDGKTGMMKSATKLPGDSHGFHIDEKAGKAYVVLTKPSLLAVVDLSQRKVAAQYTLTLSDAGSPVAVDTVRGLIFVGCPKKPMIVIFDMASGKELAGIEIPAGIDDLVYDAARDRLYASCGDGFLTILGKKDDRFAVIEKIATPKFSRTCAWHSGKLYLGVPKQEKMGGPEIHVFEAEPVNKGNARD